MVAMAENLLPTQQEEKEVKKKDSRFNVKVSKSKLPATNFMSPPKRAEINPLFKQIEEIPQYALNIKESISGSISGNDACVHEDPQKDDVLFVDSESSKVRLKIPRFNTKTVINPDEILLASFGNDVEGKEESLQKNVGEEEGKEREGNKLKSSKFVANFRQSDEKGNTLKHPGRIMTEADLLI